MKPQDKYVIRCLASGVVILTLFVTLMFWVRWTCLASQSKWTDPGSGQAAADVPLSSIVPKEFESDPCVVRHSDLAVRFDRRNIEGLMTTGLFAPLSRGLRAGLSPDVYVWEPPRKGTSGNWLYFDRGLGLFVFRGIERNFDPNGGALMTQRYAGPEGIGKTPDNVLGRFISPIASRWGYWSTYVYDARLRRFFRLNWQRQQVTKGPELIGDGAHDPIQVELVVWKSEGCFSLAPQGPMVAAGEKPNGDPNLHSVVDLRSWGGPSGSMLVLDASGRIDMLDPNTLTITSVVGSLPVMQGTFGSTETSITRGLFAYQAMPLWLWKAGERTDHQPLKYVGCVVGAMDRDATTFSVRIFNSHGAEVQTHFDKIVEQEPDFGVTKYVLENLHPPVLSMLSEVTAPYIEAASGARGIFVLPNSFIAARGRVLEEMWITRIAAGLGLIFPSLIVSGILAWQVGRDARLFGFSKNARTLWILAVAVFGIPACVTYVAMRPLMVLVTCKNCGKPRRPDMDRCHRCGSLWDVPELNPPAWRVFDGEARGVTAGANSHSPLQKTPYGVTTSAENPPAPPEQKTDSSVSIM